MPTMSEKTFLGLGITISVVLTGIIVLPARSYDVSLVTVPNKETFLLAAGEPFNITCKNSPEDVDKFSSFQWLNQDGGVIPEGVPGTQKNEKNSITLTFTDPKEDDSGVYKCVSIYDKEQILQKTVSIIFHNDGSKPKFDVDYRKEMVKENSYLKIPCVADGELPITYEWHNQYEDKITENPNSPVYVSGHENASALIIPKVALSHRGMYTCSATNRYGMSSKIFQLTVLSSKGNGNDTTVSFRNALVVNVTATSIKFDFEVTGKPNYIEVLYHRSRDNDTEYYTKCTTGDVCVFQDLIPAERYYFKFRVFPSDNDQWSKSYEVVLLPEKPEVIFQMVSSGTIKFQWLFKFDDRMKKTIDKHEITYFTVQMVGGTSWKQGSCAITIQIPECSTTSYTLSGLSNNVFYEIQLRAHTASGYGEPYTQKLFLT